MNKITCPLCNSINISLVEKINTKDIEKAYLYLLNVVTKFSFKEIKYMTCSNCNIGFFDPMATGGEELYEQLQKFEWYYMTNKPEYILAKKSSSAIASLTFFPLTSPATRRTFLGDCL